MIAQITPDFIAQRSPELSAGLPGDRAWSVVFDNRELKEFVPDISATIPFRDSIRRTLRRFAAEAQPQRIDAAVNIDRDRILDAWQRLG